MTPTTVVIQKYERNAIEKVASTFNILIEFKDDSTNENGLMGYVWSDNPATLWFLARACDTLIPLIQIEQFINK